MAQLPYDKYIADVDIKGGKTRSVMDLNVDELRECCCQLMDMLDDMEEDVERLSNRMSIWRKKPLL